jgi:N-acetyl-alpha-D-muramate 1-phosphate uridylyltransferase
MKAIILAAGKGERMRPLTDHTPKPLLTVLNKPLLVWHLEQLIQSQHITQVVINNAWLGQQIIDYIGTNYKGMPVIHSSEPECLETAGGIAHALQYLSCSNDNPFLVINGDTFIPNLSQIDWFKTAQAFKPQQLGHLYLVDNPKHNPNGDFALNNATSELCIKNTLENDNNKNSTYLNFLTFSGLALYRPSMFKHIGTQNFAKLAPMLIQGIQNKQIQGEKLSTLWMDIGTPERLHEINIWAQMHLQATQI